MTSTTKNHRNILVTGGAGYVGSHACKALAARGYKPICFDNLVNGNEWAIRWGPHVQGSLQVPGEIRAAFAEYRPDAVMHFAAYAYVGESVIDPQKYYMNNVAGALNLLQAMTEYGCDRIVFSSTCATYGIPEKTPIKEEAPLNPINPYGASKMMMERILKDYCAAYEMSASILRYFNAAGADPEGEIGEAHDPETHLIPLVLDVVAGLSPFVTVNGNDYATRDGSCIRDFVHVSDLADAHVLALEHSFSNCTSSTFNLGTGAGHSVIEVIDSCERVTGNKITVKIGARRDGDPPELVASADKARKELGWEPTLSHLDDIVETAWRWHQKRKEYDLLSGVHGLKA